jgi:hypothetical protein
MVFAGSDWPLLSDCYADGFVPALLILELMSKKNLSFAICCAV